jgi:hypothetical protein
VGWDTVAPLVVAVLAGVLVSGALWLQAGAPQADAPGPGSGAGDDAYYGR